MADPGIFTDLNTGCIASFHTEPFVPARRWQYNTAFDRLEHPAVHSTDADNDKLGQANAQERYEVSRADLPLSCPTPQMQTWNSHPRVYLPIEKTGEARCQYCGALFVLKD